MIEDKLLFCKQLFSRVSGNNIYAVHNLRTKMQKNPLIKRCPKDPLKVAECSFGLAAQLVAVLQKSMTPLTGLDLGMELISIITFAI